MMHDFAGGTLLLQKQKEINRDRKVVLAEKRARGTSSYRTFELSLKISLPDSLILKRLPIGDENVLKKVDHAALRRFCDTYYRPETDSDCGQ